VESPEHVHCIHNELDLLSASAQAFALAAGTHDINPIQSQCVGSVAAETVKWLEALR
jgi:hypothetical protein